MKVEKKLICILLFIVVIFEYPAQNAKEYNDGHGKKVSIPLGDLAFADSLISYKQGNPPPALEKCRNGNLAVGPPDFDGMDNNFTVLGTNGELTLFFKDNALINVEGTDLYVFELGKYVEETILYISKDGRNWIKVGKINGGNAAVDLGDSISPLETFRFIKLIDAGTKTKSTDTYPGADIDAVAAIGSAKMFSFNASVLFDYADSKLKSSSFSKLDSIAAYISMNPEYYIKIQGHCDSTGNKKVNEKLSLQRSLSVKKYLTEKIKNKNVMFSTEGFASDFPISPNNTESGRMKNRRVELFLIPRKIKK